MEKIFKNYAKPVFIIWLISVLCYLPFIAKGLTNSVDGLWASTYYQSGNHELSLGRWLLLFLDKGRGAYAAEPFSSFLTIFFVSVAVIISVTMFTKISYTSYIYGILILFSTTICCYLAYRFTSANYGLSVLLSICAARIVTLDIKDKKRSVEQIVISIALLVLSLGIYQANLGCFVVPIFIFMMKLILNCENKRCLNIFIKTIIVGLSSCILYKIAWIVCLFARHIDASNYNGANSVSVGAMIMGLPHSINLIYKSWFAYFGFNTGNYVFSPIRTMLVIFIFMIVISLGVIRLRKNKINFIIYCLLCLGFPVGANIAVMLAPATYSILTQMTAPMMMTIPLLLMFLEGENIKLYRISGILGVLLLYGNIFAVGTDLEALSQGSNTSYLIMNNIVTSINEEELLGDKYEYALYGNIAENQLFRTNELYDKANNYARFGTLMTKPDMICNAYAGLLDDIGVDIKTVDHETYEDILSSGILDSMPVYPTKGSILEKNGVVIVKVSDDYKWD